MTPPKNVPVKYNPEYPSDFVPKFRIEAAWDPALVGGLMLAAAVLELAIFGWVGIRTVERIRAK
jgi:adenosylcobinamide amidohydrolase